MSKVTAQEYAEKWGRRLKGATEDIRKGVDKVTEAPGVKAAAAKDRMLAKLVEAINDGTWESQVKKVTLDDWKKKMKDKGINRIAQGVDAASAEQVVMAEQLLAVVDAAAAKAKALPKVTLEDSINRMTTFVREMAKNKLRKP